MSDLELLGVVEREEARKFLSSMGLFLYCNSIFHTGGNAPALTRDEIAAVQVLWDAEWDRIKPAAETKIADREKERERARAKAEADAEGERFRQAAAKLSRKEKNRAYYFDKEMAGGFTEHHLYGPRGFKKPYKYEDESMPWTTSTLFPHHGRIGGQFSYRPSRPLGEDRALSIVTADICGDPPQGRSALEKRAHG